VNEVKNLSNKNNQALLSVKGVYKNFGGIQALSNVNLDLYDKELLALLGDNGAGKSTLIKIISGAYTRDKGKIYFEGNEVKIANPKEAKNLGIKTIYQDLALFGVLDITDNLYMGEQVTKWGFLRKREMDERSKEILSHVKTTIKSLRQQVKNLSGGQQHSVAIARGVYVGSSARIVIMDEPTAGLGVEESEKVLELLLEIRRKVAVILISHNLDHVFRVADRATVLRSGTVAGTVNIADSDKNEIVSLMMGAK
jgi:D-xylose transport system ATP-binding protein